MIDPIMPVAARIQARYAVQSPIYRMHRAAIPSVREVMKIAGATVYYKLCSPIMGDKHGKTLRRNANRQYGSPPPATATQPN